MPGSMIGYWGYKNERIHVLMDSLVLGQADRCVAIHSNPFALAKGHCLEYFFFF